MVGRGRLHVLIGLAAIFMGLVLIPESNAGATDMFSGMLDGVRQTQSDLVVKAWFSPKAGQPGDQLVLNLTLTAETSSDTSPELEIFLPGSLVLEMANLPVATSYNVQTNRLIWRPILGQTGNQVAVSIPLTVSSMSSGR